MELTIYNRKLRLTTMADLPQLKAVYRKIIEKMNQENIQIWDEIFPCEFLKEDIEKQCLYILEDCNKIAAAFSLFDTDEGAAYLNWENNEAKALYIGKLGVNVDNVRQGIGSRILEEAINLAREKGAEYLRLFVVDINIPAIKLYEKNGFKRAEGIYDLKVDADLVLQEFGYEKRITDRDEFIKSDLSAQRLSCGKLDEC